MENKYVFQVPAGRMRSAAAAPSESPGGIGHARVEADRRRGELRGYVLDGLAHIEWAPAAAKAPEDDFVVFSGVAEFKPVRQAAGGRVFQLFFLDSNAREFFYLQGSDAAADDADAARVQDFIDRSAELAAADDGTAVDGVASDSTPAAPPMAAAAISSAIARVGGPSGPGGAAGARGKRQRKLPSLRPVLDASRIAPLLAADPALVEELAPLLPGNGPATAERVLAALRSTPLRETLEMLDRGLNAGELGAVMLQIGLPQGAGQYGVLAFLDAVRAQWGGGRRAD